MITEDIGHVVARLRELGACPDALEWLAAQRSLEEAWRTCCRGDWMLWYLMHVTQEGTALRQRVLYLVCRIAEDALQYAGHFRPVCEKAIAAARGCIADRSEANCAAAYAAWKVSEQGNAAANAADVAVEAACAAYAAWAAANTAWAAANTAWATGAAAFAAAAVAYAARAAAGAARAATDAAWAAAQAACLTKYADWVRKEFPKAPVALRMEVTYD